MWMLLQLYTNFFENSIFFVLFVLEACRGVKLQPAMRELPEADEATRGRGRGHHGDDGLARGAARGGSRTTVAWRRAFEGAAWRGRLEDVSGCKAHCAAHLA